MANWFYKLDGREYGPVAANELRCLAQQSEIDINTAVRREQDLRWVTAATVRGLFNEPLATVEPPSISTLPKPVGTQHRSARHKQFVFAACFCMVTVIVMVAAFAAGRSSVKNSPAAKTTPSKPIENPRAVPSNVVPNQSENAPVTKPKAERPQEPLDNFKSIVSVITQAEGNSMHEDTAPHYRMRNAVRTPEFNSIAKIDLNPRNRSTAAMERELAEVGRIMKDAEARMKEYDRVFANGERWEKTYYWISDVAYDVQKTESLVSPYTGTLEFTYHSAWSKPHKQADAKLLRLDQCNDYSETLSCKAMYAFQDDKWILKELLTKKDRTFLIDPEPKWTSDTALLLQWASLTTALRAK